jgi:hypothetical protein
VEITRARTLVAVGVVCLVLAFPLTGWVAERWPQWLSLPWPLSALLTAAGLAALGLARLVRQYTHGKRPQLDPLRAASVAAYAKSCSLVGAALTGAYMAVVARAIVEWSSPPFHLRALLAGIAVLACAWLCAAGQIGQMWCRVPPTETP